MSIINQLPHTARATVPGVRATALFGVPIAGKYSFSTALNKDLPLFVAKANKAYLIERIMWAGSLPESDWTDSVSADRPRISLYSKHSGQQISIDPYPYPLSKYTQGSDFVGWILNQREDLQIYCKVEGALEQVANTVGVNSMSLSADFGIYELGDLTSARAFLDRISHQSGQQLTGSL